MSTQRYFPKTAAVAESPPTPTTAPPSTTTVEAVDVADPVTEPATSTDDGIPYGDVCTQVEEFRDALGEFTGQPVSDQDAIDATIEFYRTEGASAGMDEATLNGLVELLRDC